MYYKEYAAVWEHCLEIFLDVSLFLKLSILYTAGDVGIYKMFHNELLYFVTAEIVVVPSLVVINVSFAFSIKTD